MRHLVLLTLLLASCATSNGDLHLKGDAAEAFRAITGHSAVTFSERRTIYGTDDPPSAMMECHEKQGHGEQAKVVTDALVKIGAIDDDEPSRIAAWVSIYSIEHVRVGYRDSRWEQGARERCKHLMGVP